MTHLQKLGTTSILKWVSSNFVQNHLRSSKTTFGSTGLFHVAQNPRLYSTGRTVRTEKSKNLDETSSFNGENVSRISLATRREAQVALREYLHYTRSLQYMDAENMCKNSPLFLEKLLKKVENEADIGRSIARFLRYHPINEFEPFFESLGLQPFEYGPLLPRDLMFLSDDDLLLENYHVLCNYGIERNKMGKIYKEAIEVFRYDVGVLPLKLRAYEELGLGQSFVAKLIVCSPYLLIGDVNVKLVKVLEVLKSVGIDYNWIEEHLLEKDSYNWSRILRILRLFSVMGCSEEQLGGLISQHPGLIFEGSGDGTLSLIGFLFKFGSTMDKIHPIFLQFPQIQVGRFVANFRQCFLFLNEIEMTVDEIEKIVHSYPLMLGSCTLKKTNTILVTLNVGKKRLCKFIQENPQELKKWVMGSRVGPLPNSGEDLRSQMLRTKFLLDLGFVENSAKMEKALKVFRGKGTELQERFDCIVKAGLDRKDVSEMVRVSPQILNQSKDIIQMKIDFLVKDLGYPISSLVTFPSCLSYTIPRVKLRFSMYNWLKDQGAAEPMLALSTVIASADKYFMSQYVSHHPRGPQVWEDLKKQIYSE